MEKLQQKLAVMIPELLEANGLLADNEIRKILINLFARIGTMETPRLEASSSAPALRERELEWWRTHGDTLRHFENEWVVLEVDDVIAHGVDAVKVIEEARAKGIKRPYVFFVEPKNEEVIQIGL